MRNPINAAIERGMRTMNGDDLETLARALDMAALAVRTQIAADETGSAELAKVAERLAARAMNEACELPW